VTLNEPGGRIAYRFHGPDLNLVLGARPGTGALHFRLLLDGESPHDSHGLDADEQGAGTGADDRLYQLVRRHGPIDDRTVEITFADAGAQAYVFTFG
jgi:hypothetical protein